MNNENMLDAASDDGVQGERSEIKRPESPVPKILYEDIAGDVRSCLARGEKISAIHLVQGLTGMGMQEAKVFVERIEANG